MQQCSALDLARISSVRVNCPAKVYARLHVSISATYLFRLVDLSYEFFVTSLLLIMRTGI